MFWSVHFSKKAQSLFLGRKLNAVELVLCWHRSCRIERIFETYRLAFCSVCLWWIFLVCASSVVFPHQQQITTYINNCCWSNSFKIFANFTCLPQAKNDLKNEKLLTPWFATIHIQERCTQLWQNQSTYYFHY